MEGSLLGEGRAWGWLWHLVVAGWPRWHLLLRCGVWTWPVGLLHVVRHLLWSTLLLVVVRSPPYLHRLRSVFDYLARNRTARRESGVSAGRRCSRRRCRRFGIILFLLLLLFFLFFFLGLLLLGLFGLLGLLWLLVTSRSGRWRGVGRLCCSGIWGLGTCIGRLGRTSISRFGSWLSLQSCVAGFPLQSRVDGSLGTCRARQGCVHHSSRCTWRSGRHVGGSGPCTRQRL